MTSPPELISFRRYQPEDRAWVEAAHLRHYTGSEGFSPDFGEAVSSALDLLEARISDEKSQFIVVQAAERPVGCVFFCAETESAGRIRLFYLEPAHRGRGIGRTLLTRIIDHARDMGFETVCVSTFERHVDACRLYAALGFKGRTSGPLTAFGKTVRQVDFVLDLAAPARS